MAKLNLMHYCKVMDMKKNVKPFFSAAAVKSVKSEVHGLGQVLTVVCILIFREKERD